LQPPFCMPECAKTHLQQSRISKFYGGGPADPLFKGREGKGKGGRRGRGKGREGGRGRIGKGGEEREGTGEGKREGGEEWAVVGGEGRGARHGLRPLETSSGSAPEHGRRQPESSVGRLFQMTAAVPILGVVLMMFMTKV